MSDAGLVRAFEACDPALGSLSHAEHLRIAWHYLQHASLGIAGERFRTGLRLFAASRGGGARYHETITWAYVVMLAQCRDELGEPAPFRAVETHWPELLDHRDGALRRIYSATELAHPLARTTFVLPGLSFRSPARPGCAAPDDERGFKIG